MPSRKSSKLPKGVLALAKMDKAPEMTGEWALAPGYCANPPSTKLQPNQLTGNGSIVLHF
jgi:hypothetical protein